MSDIEISSMQGYLHQSKAQEYFLIKNHWRAIERATARKITDTMDETYKYSPEYIIIENERKAILDYFWKRFKLRINPLDFAYFIKYLSYQNNALETSKTVEISNVAITKRIKKSQKVAFKLLQDMGLSINDFKQFLAPTMTDYFARTTQQTGYPFEHFMNLPEKKEWQGKYGTKMVVKKKSCLIPEYLADCGLCNSQCVICADTNNCRRKDVYPSNDNAEAIKKHMAEVEACIDASIRNTPKEDYEGLECVYSL